MLRKLYSGLFTLLLPVVFCKLLIRSIRLPAYRYRWKERLGMSKLPNLQNSLWVHAVSVGEILASVPMIKRFQAQYPEASIVITTMTPTGSQRVQDIFYDVLGKQVFHVYVPYDISWVVKRFLNRINPKLVILMETELWPNILHYCGQKKIPVLIANARLSVTSFYRYRKVPRVVKRMLDKVSIVAAQSTLDAKRFQRLGMHKKKVKYTGNIKFDLQLPRNIYEVGTQLRSLLGSARPIWVAASTHEGEESLLLAAFKQLKRNFPYLLLILVPRHPERFDTVSELCGEKGFQIVRRSQKIPCTMATDIYVGDTMGELLSYYAASDVAFVGGSLVPIGGHNLLEPAALGIPVLTGPHLFNFVSISKLLFKGNGAQMVTDVVSMVQVISDLLSDANRRDLHGKCAKKVVQKNCGAIKELFLLIDALWCSD